MRISIVTVCRNSAETIAGTIRSVAGQEYSDKEHLIIDGASTDETLEIVRQHPSVSRCVSEPDLGIYDAMNKGIELATGEVVGTLNADDIYVDNQVLSEVARAFLDPSIDACYADLVYVDQLDLNKVIRYWKSRPFAQGLSLTGWMPAHPTFFVRREVYERFGKFDLSFKRQADFELTLRLLEVHQIRTAYLPRVWVKMRMGGVSNNSVLGVFKGNLEAYHACRKHGFQVWLVPFILRKIMSRVPQFFTKP